MPLPCSIFSAARSPLLLLLAALLLSASGCPGRRAPSEVGEECWDGKDNDGDGILDCNDPDCSIMPVCNAYLQDAGVWDLAQPADHGTTPTPDRGGPLQDSSVIPPLPDQGSTAGSYGKTCSNIGNYCADQATVCLPSPKSGRGFCSIPCTTLGQTCKGGPGGSFAACAMRVGDRPYCAFLCKWKGQSHSCPPSGFSCVPDGKIPQYQAWCWPN